MQKLVLISAVIIGVFTISLLLGSTPSVVRNTNSDELKAIRLTPELVIGVEDGAEHETFGRIRDIAVSPARKIYVLDNGFRRVQVYNHKGSYIQSIGRQGPGPGEFSYPSSITVDKDDNLYVGDQPYIKIFDSKGEFVDAFKHEAEGGLIQSVRIDNNTGWLYVSCVNILEQKVIHAYTETRELALSFCDTWAKDKDVDVRIEQATAGGHMDIDEDGLLYYSQFTPYEIRIYSPHGSLLSTIHRETDFMIPARVEQTPNGMRLRMPTACSSIVVINGGRFVNVMKKAGNEDGPAQAVLDLFASDGKLLASQMFERDLHVRCSDSAGMLYAVDQSEFPRLVKYRLSLADR
jgi:hypothetical protein